MAASAAATKAVVSYVARFFIADRIICCILTDTAPPEPTTVNVTTPAVMDPSPRKSILLSSMPLVKGQTTNTTKNLAIRLGAGILSIAANNI
jgi:hypothetical protein